MTLTILEDMQAMAADKDLDQVVDMGAMAAAVVMVAQVVMAVAIGVDQVVSEVMVVSNR